MYEQGKMRRMNGKGKEWRAICAHTGQLNQILSLPVSQYSKGLSFSPPGSTAKIYFSVSLEVLANKLWTLLLHATSKTGSLNPPKFNSGLFPVPPQHRRESSKAQGKEESQEEGPWALSHGGRLPNEYPTGL